MNMNQKMSVLYIGNYDQNYPRNYNFIIGLKQNGINITEINLDGFNNFQICKFFFQNFRKILKQKFEVVIYYSLKNSLAIIFSRIIALIKRVPFIHDIFISKLITYYYDYELETRKKYIPKLFYYLYFYFSDFLECHFSNYVFIDTYSHIKYFHEKFKISLNKFRRVYIGNRDDLFYPLTSNKKETDKLKVGFWGGYIPLQGIKYIIKAIKLLESESDLSFTLLGNGITYKKNRELANSLEIKNTKFIDFQPIKEIPKLISKFDIGLGIFGKKLKTRLVIPNKIFEGIGMKIPMITSRSSAINELLEHNKNIVLCESGNPQSLADAIMKLKSDDDLREKISVNSYEINKKYCTTNKIGKRLLAILNKIT